MQKSTHTFFFFFSWICLIPKLDREREGIEWWIAVLDRVYDHLYVDPLYILGSLTSRGISLLAYVTSGHSRDQARRAKNCYYERKSGRRLQARPTPTTISLIDCATPLLLGFALLSCLLYTFASPLSSYSFDLLLFFSFSCVSNRLVLSYIWKRYLFDFFFWRNFFTFS